MLTGDWAHHPTLLTWTASPPPSLLLKYEWGWRSIPPSAASASAPTPVPWAAQTMAGLYSALTPRQSLENGGGGGGFVLALSWNCRVPGTKYPILSGHRCTLRQRSVSNSTQSLAFAPPLAPCERNTKVPKCDGDNTSCCSETGVVCARRARGDHCVMNVPVVRRFLNLHPQRTRRGAARGGRPGPVLVCDTLQPPPPPEF